MAVTEGFVTGPPDAIPAGKKIDTTQVTQSDLGVAHREGAVVVDPEFLDARGRVRSGSGDSPILADDYGAVHREALTSPLSLNMQIQVELLTSILVELRVLSELMKQGLNVRDDLDILRRDNT